MKNVLTTQDLSLAHGLRVALEAEGIAVVPNADASSISSHAPTTVTVLRDEDHIRAVQILRDVQSALPVSKSPTVLRILWLALLLAVLSLVLLTINGIL